MPTKPLSLPPTDETVNARLNALRQRQQAISAELAHAELACAAHILVALFGAHAAQLLVAKDENLSGDTTIVPMVLFDDDDELIWFNPSDYQYNSRDYPGAEDIQTEQGRPVHDVDDQVPGAIAAHLEAAYDAFGGCIGALDVDSDDHLGTDDVNVLVLHIPAALEPWHTKPDSAPA